MKTAFVLGLLFYSSAFALQNYCNSGYKPIGDKSLTLDLSKLNQEFTLYQNKSTPPSTRSVITQINMCDALSISEESQFQCKKGTYICQKVVYNQDNKDFVAEVLTIAGEFEKSKLDAEFKPVKSEADSTKSGYQYSLALSGGDNGQSALITLECDTSQSREDKPTEPTIVSFHNNVLTLQWKTVFACATEPQEKKPDDGGHQGGNEEPKKEGMSGIRIFFTIIFVLLAVYFIGGAFYNYRVYNARGLDLIPHREFWLDLPYLIRDLIAHIIDSIMSRRRGGGGYVAV
ncbi:hypothetical protein RMATCC62417_07449 [Rhizopus microsporus]|nr:hypothetical protein RMATCC62417_07449 [Rhizopus microsporus]